MNAEANKCPKCGARLPVNVSEGLCPSCLMQQAMNVTLQSDEPMPSIVGKPVIRYFGNYELQHEIARGGMGVVYKARQVNLNRTVAVKTILTGNLADDEAIKRFHTEAEAAANLQHPNIVAIHEVGEHEGLHYFSMDFVEGKNLAQVAGGKPIAATKAAEYVRKMAAAIHFAHQRGTLHRDLKPSNVLIDEHDEPRITDFGLAKIAGQDGSLTRSGSVLGTPNYMAPEQAAARADQIGPQSDVYSLGAILYELLTGRPPFKADTIHATLMKVANAEPVAPHKINVGVPADLETVCLKCLEKSPQLRYASARDLAEDLGRFLKHEPVLAKPASAWRKTSSWCRRQPLALAGIAALVIFGLAFFGFYLSEENAFLRAKMADPQLVQKAGPITDALFHWRMTCSSAMIVSIWVLFAYMRAARGVPWKQLYDPLFMTVLKSAGPRWRATLLLFGLAAIASSVIFQALLIRAKIWEGRPHSGDYMTVFASLYWGVWLISHAIRDHQRALFGSPSRELNAEQAAKIRAELLEYNVPNAIWIYRKMIPDASLAEARDHVTRMIDEIRATDPEVFAGLSKKLNPLDVNVWNLMVCGFIEGVVFAVMLFRFGHVHPAYFSWHIAAGFLLGAGIMIGGRVKGFWKRLLLISPWFIMLVVSDFVLGGDTVPGLASKGLLSTIGMLFGVVLMMSGYTKKRKKPAAT